MATPTPILQGDSPTFRFEIKTPAGDPFNLVDYTANFFIKRSLQDADSAAEFNGLLSSGVEVVFTPQDGVIDVTVPVVVTNNLRIGRLYPWYLVLTHSVITGKVFKPVRGTFIATLPNTD